ncbi:lipopolysaccharide transport periplasmic protein LptA [Dyella sp.]|jgi:lipopolysaccharide export system protein LptA|uniref:lipopolysaccharide transport periplasmic protein LptA n=1 Tax=Dyella sp. TaxID=1869338 RepID=UPI002D799B5D|nr:lipopolysaccharide transport periplasmic protein LptA [Dyella sp.]HET6430703.1 lipopolysaccharide transport periplasmic protein LptA [Dyella sp.]
MTSTPRSRRASISARWLLAACGLLALSPAIAKQGDRDQPMQVDAKYFDGFRSPNTVSTLKGAVVIQQGSLKATGALAKVYFDAESQISRIVLTGSPAHIEQLDDSGNRVLGDAATIDYDNIKGIAVLTGNASVKQQGRGEARGDKLTYDTASSQMTGESGGSGTVHMVFQPKKKPPAAPPSPAAPATPAPATTTQQP